MADIYSNPISATNPIDGGQSVASPVANALNIQDTGFISGNNISTVTTPDSGAVTSGAVAEDMNNKAKVLGDITNTQDNQDQNKTASQIADTTSQLTKLQQTVADAQKLGYGMGDTPLYDAQGNMVKNPNAATTGSSTSSFLGTSDTSGANSAAYQAYVKGLSNSSTPVGGIVSQAGANAQGQQQGYDANGNLWTQTETGVGTPQYKTSWTLTTPATGKDYQSWKNNPNNSYQEYQANGGTLSQSDWQANGSPSQSIATGDQTESIVAQLAQQNRDMQTSDTQVQQDLANIRNGLLTADEQKQVDALTAQWQSLITAQGVTNENYTNATTEIGISQGVNRYAPNMQIDQVQKSIQLGATKIADLTNQMNSAISTMKQGFKNDDYKMVSDAYSLHEKAQTDISTNLQKMYDTITAAQKDARDFNYQVEQDKAKAILDNAHLTLDQQAAELNKLQLTETERHNLVEESISRETAAKGTYQIKQNDDGTQSIFNSSTGEVIGSPTNSVVNGQMNTPFSNGSYQPNQTGNPLFDTNMKQTSNGVWYLDGTNLSGKQATALQLQAAQLGIPYLSKAASGVVQKADDVKSNMASISAMIDNLPNNAFTRMFVGPLNNIAAAVQQNPGLASFNTWRTAAIATLQALAGGAGSGLRINQAEILMSIKNDIPNIDDTKDTAKSKIIKITTMLDNQEKSLFGPNYDIQKAEGSASNSTEALKNIGGLNPSYQKQIQAIQAKFPDYTDDEIIQTFDPNNKTY